MSSAQNKTLYIYSLLGIRQPIFPILSFSVIYTQNPQIQTTKMGSIGETHMTPTQASDEEANLIAMQLASASVLPMVLKSAIELELLEIIAKAGPGACLSPSEIASQLQL